MIRSGILAVGAEVALAHELEVVAGLCTAQGGLHLAAGKDLQRVGIQALQEVLVGGVGIWLS